MVITKVFSLTELLSYQIVLLKIAEEHGGGRTAYYYDLLTRQKIAKALEAKDTNLASLLGTMDIDVVKESQMKISQAMQEAGRDRARAGGGKGYQNWAPMSGKKGGNGGKANIGGKGQSNGQHGYNQQKHNHSDQHGNRARQPQNRDRSRSPRNDRQKQGGNGGKGSKGKH
jgi:hypothetical protein